MCVPLANFRREFEEPESECDCGGVRVQFVAATHANSLPLRLMLDAYAKSEIPLRLSMAGRITLARGRSCGPTLVALHHDDACTIGIDNG